MKSFLECKNKNFLFKKSVKSFLKLKNKSNNTMPNFCENLVNFSHSNPEMIERVLKANNEGTLFQEFVPCPEEPESGW